MTSDVIEAVEVDETDDVTHPKMRERRAAVEDAATRRRARRWVALGVLAILGVIGYGVTQSPLLDVDEVRVIGAARVGPNELRSVAGIEPGTPLVGLDLNAAVDRLQRLPSVASVEAERTWSGVVTFAVTERPAVARIDTPEGSLVVSADGIVLDRTGTPETGLPLISGAMFSAEVGTVVPGELSPALAVAEGLPSDIARVVERIELSVDDVGLRLRGGGVVSMGDARQLEPKFDAVRAFLAQVDLRCLQRIDVQAPLVPVLTRADGCF